MARRFFYVSAGLFALVLAVGILAELALPSGRAEWVGAAIGAASLAVALVVIAHARRQAVETLRVHIGLTANWALGRDGRGWSDEDVRPFEKLLWSRPQFSVLGIYSAGAFAQVGLLGNLTLSPDLAPRLALVSQSLQVLNDAVAQCEAFKLADVHMYLTAQEKLRTGIKVVLGENAVPQQDLTHEQLMAIFKSSGLSEAECCWCRTLAGLWHTVHVAHIGNARKTALFRHFADLQSEFERIYGPS